MSARLPVRLAGAFLAVLAVGTLASLVTVRVLAPQLFDRRMGMSNGRMMGGEFGANGTRDAMIAALNQSLLVGALIAAAIAGVVAVVLARGVLRPLDQVRAAAQLIAAGRYDVRVPQPGEPEMAALAEDVNTLAAALAGTEARRMQLLGEVAHEMRTPLTGLSRYVEGMVDGVFRADEPTLTAMTEDLRRLRRLADDLSALSRSDEGRLELALAPIDLADVVRRTCDRLAPQLAERGVQLDVRAPGPLPVTADTDRIGQVLTNLLTNAARATGQGTVTVLAAGSGGTASVSVADHGVGLAAGGPGAGVRALLPGARRRAREGSGIGLTIARGIARAHGGDLVAHSAGPGQGATFTLTLPSA